MDGDLSQYFSAAATAISWVWDTEFTIIYFFVR